MKRWVCGVCVALGCSGGKDTAGGVGVDGAAVSGRITAESSFADVQTMKGFAFATAGTGLIYLSSGEGATCASVAEYLDFDTGEYDPSELWPPETCNLFLRFGYETAAGFDGLVVAGDDPLNPWILNCAMDSGAWEYGTSNGFTDYFYSGRYYQGSPNDGTSTITGQDGALTVDVSFSSYNGGFTYEEMENVPASGSVSGSVATEWCTDLGATGYF
jgi:hypothetical protein